MPMNLSLGLGLGSIPVNEGVAPILQRIFADGTDGFYFDFSKTDRLFQDLANTPADGAGENIYLGLEGHSWAGRTYAQELAQQPELVTNGDFDTDLTGWVSVGSGTSWSSGKLAFNLTSNTSAGRWRNITVTPGVMLEAEVDVDVTVIGAGSGIALRIYDGASLTGTLFAVSKSTTGATRLKLKMTPTGSTVTFYMQGFANTGTTLDATFDNASLKKIPGNHGLQATTSAQPKWQTGGLARFDGSDDNLLTTLVPGTAMTLMFKGKITSASKGVMGSRATTDTRVLIGTDANGLLAGAVGADSTTTIKGGSDIRGATGVGALVYNPSGVMLYWNGASIYTGALNGTPNTSVPLRLGAFNDNGTASTFADADIYHALAIQKALTADEIAAITNLWGTT